MCKNNKCKIRHTCYRYMCIPSAQQSYAYFNGTNCFNAIDIDDRVLSKSIVKRLEIQNGK